MTSESWKDKHANDAERALEHEMVKGVIDEFADNLRHNPDVAAGGFYSGLFCYGFRKCMSYVAQVARAQALGFDPDTLRMTPGEVTEAQINLARMAVEAGKPVHVIEDETFRRYYLPADAPSGTMHYPPGEPKIR